MKRSTLVHALLCAASITLATSALRAEPNDGPAKSSDAPLAGPKPDHGNAPKGKDFAGDRKRHGEGGPMVQVLKNLNLSEEQDSKIKDILKSHMDKMNQYKAETRDKFEGLKADMEKAKSANDKEKMDSIRKQMADIEKNAPKRSEVVSQVAEVLTPEQREKFRAQMEEVRKNMEDKRPDKPKDMMNQDKNDKKDGKHEKKDGKNKPNDNGQLKL